MQRVFMMLMLAALTAPSARAQFSAVPQHGEPPTKTTFLRLANNANAILVEPLTLDPVKSRIAVIVTHPEHVNNFNYFIGRALPGYGYRVLMLNYYGPEQTYYEFIAPIAAAIRALRAIPGVEKVVLAGHSSGGPEITSYQDVAENGAKACQGPERVYKCDGKGLEGLPAADGVMLLDSAAGAPERSDALNPAVNPHHPRQHTAAIDMFDARNGYDPSTKAATYSPQFLKRYFAAQAARSRQLIEEALARLAKIDTGEGEYKDDEPFVVAGSTVQINGARPQLADIRLLSKTHAPHLLLKADGSAPVQIIPQVFGPQASPDDQDLLFATTLNVTVRSYLSFQGLRLDPDYHMTEDNVFGVQWRSTPNSIQGNLEGIRVPTLIMSGTCAPHAVYLEIAYDHSAAKDKQMAGVEGANHGFLPCRPEFGDTFKRTFDFVDRWLSLPGRL